MLYLSDIVVTMPFQTFIGMLIWIASTSLLDIYNNEYATRYEGNLLMGKGSVKKQ